ncbi:MAG: DUF4827 domain-containing protein [Dysgonamonadaceae bacterium]|jgi:hypothetical protein|nr:DUF4827 domain-containing protein [Dysgonamonadaceae bacterium]
MRKTVLFISSILILGIISLACERQKTTQEYLREERKAIERFLDRQGIRVRETYPAEHRFAENEYFKTNEGIYFQVVDSGNGDKIDPFVDVEDVQVRLDYLFNIKSYVSGRQDTLVPVSLPMSFLSGSLIIYGNRKTTGSSYTNISGPGWAYPLKYVREGAVVNMILPSSFGNQSDNANFVPRFYKNLKYTKFY